ncbi:unnamed protein product [Closterium sp. NIES-53]
MEVARTSMIHAAAPHFLWPFAVQFATHQLNLWPCVSLPETSPTLRLMGKVGDASVSRVWGSRAFVRDTSADKLSARAIPCVFLGFPLDAPGWQFYHPTPRRLTNRFPFTVSSPTALPLFLAPGPPPVDPLPPQGPTPSGVYQVDPLPLAVPVEVAVDSGAARGAASRGAASGVAVSEGAETARAELGGADPEGAGCGGAEPGSAGPGGAEPVSAEPGATDLSLHRSCASGLLGAPAFRVALLEPGGSSTGGAGDTEAGAATGTRDASLGGACTDGTGAAEAGGAAGVGAGGLGAGAAGGTGAGAAGGTRAACPGAARTGGTGAAGAGGAACVGAGDPGAGDTGDGGDGPWACVSSCLACSRCSQWLHVPRPRPPPVPGTHAMALRPSSVPQRVPLPSPPASSLAHGPDHESDLVRAASPTVPLAELVDFAAACPLDYAASLVAKSESDCPPSVGGESALGTDVLEDRKEDFECLAAAVPHLVSMLLAPEGDPDASDIPNPRSYAEAIMVPPLKANIVDGMWIFRGSLHQEIWLRRPPGFTGSFRAGTQWSLRRPFYGLRQAHREWHNKLRTTLAALGFAPSIADPSLFLRTDTSLLPFYVLVYVDDIVFATADTKALALVKLELQKRHTCTDLDELRSYLGLQITRDRAWCTITLTQSHMEHQVLQRFGFRYSSPKSTPLPTGHSLSAPPSDKSVEPSGLYPELVGCLMYLMTCTRLDLAYPLSILARYVAPGRHRSEHWEAAKRVLRYLCSTSDMGLVLGGRGPVVLTGHVDSFWVDDLATQRSSHGYTFSLGSGSVSWRFTRCSSVLSSSCDAGIYSGAMAAQELRWLTYLLTDLGERPRSSPVLYVDNKAMIALCQEHRLEHRTKHIALCYFLARELKQRGQIHLAYVATRANTAYIFTKAFQSSDHQRFCTVLGLVPTLPHLLTA